MGRYSPLKENEIMELAGKWMELESTEVIQTQKDSTVFPRLLVSCSKSSYVSIEHGMPIRESHNWTHAEINGSWGAQPQW